MPNQQPEPRSVAEVLADWRDAERRIQHEQRGTPAWHRARLDAARLADEYQALVAELTNEARDLGADRSTTPSEVVG